MGDKKTVLDFLNKKFDAKELASALKILYEFKKSFSWREDLHPPLQAWLELEHFQEYLEYRVNKKPLRDDTLQYIKDTNFKLNEED